MPNMEYLLEVRHFCGMQLNLQKSQCTPTPNITHTCALTQDLQIDNTHKYLEEGWYSLEQYIGFEGRQAFQLLL